MEQTPNLADNQPVVSKPQTVKAFSVVGLVIFSLVASVIATGAFYLLKPEEVQVPMATGTPMESSTAQPELTPDSWKVYRSEQRGFETRYPSDWFVSEEQSNVTFSSYDTESAIGRGGCCPDINARIDIYVTSKPTAWSLEKEQQDQFQGIGHLVDIAGIQGVQGFTRQPEDGPPSQVFLTRVPYGDKLYDVSIQGSIDAYTDMYNRILAEFKFIN